MRPRIIHPFHHVHGELLVRQTLPADQAIEHAAERGSVYRNVLDSKADDGATERIHDNQDPSRTKQDRIVPEQIQTPQAMLGCGRAPSATKAHTGR